MDFQREKINGSGEKNGVPGQRTGKWLPSIFEVRFIWATIFLAVELWIYERTRKRIVERI